MTARVDVTALSEGQRAGLAMFGVLPAWVGVAKQEGALRLLFSNAGQEEVIAPLDAEAAQLCVQVGTDQQARFSFSLDEGRTFTPAGVPVQLHFSWWKGARPAVFT